MPWRRDRPLYMDDPDARWPRLESSRARDEPRRRGSRGRNAPPRLRASSPTSPSLPSHPRPVPGKARVAHTPSKLPHQPWHHTPYPSTSHHLFEALQGKTKATLETLAAHGFDPFWYSMSMSVPPTDSQVHALRSRLWNMLVTAGPDEVAEAVRDGTYVARLGPEFAWVRLPVMKEHTSIEIFNWPKDDDVCAY